MTFLLLAYGSLARLSCPYPLPMVKCGCTCIGRGYFAECGKLSRGNLQKIKCETFRKLPLIAFPYSAAEKFCISVDLKTTVRSHCTTDVQPMHSSVWRPTVSSFFILCGPFAKEQGSFFGWPFVKSLALCYRTVVCLYCPVCDVGVLWPNGWTDQDETWQWHPGRPRLWPHCVRWEPMAPPQRGTAPNFQPISVAAKWLHGSRCHLVWR